jgi:hypothetical protein
MFECRKRRFFTKKKEKGKDRLSFAIGEEPFMNRSACEWKLSLKVWLEDQLSIRRQSEAWTNQKSERDDDFPDAVPRRTLGSHSLEPKKLQR